MIIRWKRHTVLSHSSVAHEAKAFLESENCFLLVVPDVVGLPYWKQRIDSWACFCFLDPLKQLRLALRGRKIHVGPWLLELSVGTSNMQVQTREKLDGAAEKAKEVALVGIVFLVGELHVRTWISSVSEASLEPLANLEPFE